MDKKEVDLEQLFQVTERDFSSNAIPHFRKPRFAKKRFVAIPSLLCFTTSVGLVLNKGLVISEFGYKTFSQFFTVYSQEVNELIMHLSTQL